MRRDEVEQLREQKKHYLAELRALVSRGDWSPQDNERANYLERELRSIGGTLEDNHRRELEEIVAQGARAARRVPSSRPSAMSVPSLQSRCTRRFEVPALRVASLLRSRGRSSARSP